MDRDDSDGCDAETSASQQAAYELQQEYDFESHSCDLDAYCAYDPYPPEPILAPRAVPGPTSRGRPFPTEPRL
eukprot:5853010-Heterocapsa_arctica.AAC.1